MPSRNRSALVAVLGVLGVVVPLYTTLVIGQVLLGVAIGGLLLLAAGGLRFGEPELAPRQVATWVVVGLVVLYGAVTSDLLLAVLVGAVVYLVGWLTDPARANPPP